MATTFRSAIERPVAYLISFVLIACANFLNTIAGHSSRVTGGIVRFKGCLLTTVANFGFHDARFGESDGQLWCVV